MNIFDYLRWRCDVPFSAAPFNLADNLILSELIYTDFGGIVPEDGRQIELKEACSRFFTLHDRDEISARKSYTARAPFLMESMLQGSRFSSLRLSRYHAVIDKDLTTQFAAITFHLSDGTDYVAFRGTDGTVVGWKEDFLLSYRSGTTGQQEAAAYLDTAAMATACPLRVGGHSKGGNLAVYAAVFCRPETLRRIVKVYTNDGPGFRSEVTSLPAYRGVMPLTVSVVPDTSVIGLLLKNDCERVVVRSTASGITQHDGFSWETTRDGFVPASISRTAEIIQKAISHWVEGLDDETLQSLVDSVFTLIEATGEDTFHSMSQQKLKTAEAMILAMRGLPWEKQKELLSVTAQLLQSGGTAVTKTITFRNNQNATTAEE